MSNTQAQSILNLIRQNNAKGTENWRLVEISLKYSSRISELRQKGYDIYSTRTKVNGKPTGTWLYFINEKQPEPAKPAPTENTKLFNVDPQRRFL